jgi:hydroxymethylglutaryl-CoA reductase
MTFSKCQVEGFSRLSKHEKRTWVRDYYLRGDSGFIDELTMLDIADTAMQDRIDGFIENPIGNYPLPFAIAPNFKINGRDYAVPMVIEESSVVAAASAAAKFWYPLGGFHAEVVSSIKIGQVHFNWCGDSEVLMGLMPALKKYLLEASEEATANMRQRGGGVLGMELLDFTNEEPYYYQLRVTFETCNSMGANFINTVLEIFASHLPVFIADHPGLKGTERHCEVVMAILSNYTPQCLVKAWVETPIEHVGFLPESDTVLLARKIAQAVRIAQIDTYRAVTHNKGIFNGIDAVALATGQDFRAIEACAHAYAARDGKYRSLSSCTVENGIFRFELTVPFAVGVVGGLTRLHPMAKRALDILGNPDAHTLMCIIAATGLAQNFAAVRSLVTTGIQKGHMKMHLKNMLIELGASTAEQENAQSWFRDKTVSHTAVRQYLETMRTT